MFASATLLLPLSGCGGEWAPMGYMRTFGPAADPITWLGWGLTTVSVLTVLIIAALLLGAIFRRREAGGEEQGGLPPLKRSGSGLRWIYIGVGISAVVLFASSVWTLVTLAAVARPPVPPAFTIRVIGHQWWWEVVYRNGAGEEFVTANEIHIPVGRPVRLELVTDDVIHSFWVPALAGKTDMIPSQVNLAWLQASEPGVYRGQCAEFCLQQHAHMAFLVIADPPEVFEAWWRNQLLPPPPPVTEAAQTGAALFMTHCAGCHRVRGTPADGALGPDLTHLATRLTIASATLANNTGSLAGWVANAQAIKPGVRMPNMAPSLTGPQLRAVVAYLQTLH